MGRYSKWFFPRICDRLMSIEALTEQRKSLLSDVSGEVLEVGFGTGLNLPHYPAAVTRLTAADINPGMLSLAEKRSTECPFNVDHRLMNGETLALETGRFDCAVSTWVLCSIREVEQALAEIRRVLKPEGRLFFIEHGLSDDSTVQRWQNRLNGLQKKIADGCNLNRDMKALIQSVGFDFERLETFYVKKAPKTHGFTFRGVAIPS